MILVIFYRKSVRFYTASPRSVTSSYPTLATRLPIHPRHSAAEGTSSGNDSTWDDGSAWKRERAAGRGQCRDAEPFSGEEPEAV